jgi:hypothetical protein
MTVFQQDVGLPNIPSLSGWKFMTLAGITVPSLRLKQMVKLCRIRINLHDKNELFMQLRVHIRLQAFCAHFLRACYASLYCNYDKTANFKYSMGSS